MSHKFLLFLLASVLTGEKENNNKYQDNNFVDIIISEEERRRKIINNAQNIKNLRRLKFESEWVFWNSVQPEALQQKGLTHSSYLAQLHKMNPMATVSQLLKSWPELDSHVFQHQDGSVFLFKEGILPSWEDVQNKHGGKITVYFAREKTQQAIESFAKLGFVLTMQCSQKNFREHQQQK